MTSGERARLHAGLDFVLMRAGHHVAHVVALDQGSRCFKSFAEIEAHYLDIDLRSMPHEFADDGAGGSQDQSGG
jgi:hypothetical protein